MSELEQKETTRLEAFSDGVFAIAITLLVLELKVPHRPHEDASNAGLLRALLELWPSYMALVISFGTILIMWISHHRLVDLVRKVDSTFMLLNGFLLLQVTLVPFPTAVLAEYFGHEGSKMACLVYCGLYFWIGMAYNLLWHYSARGNRLLKSSITPSQKASITKRYLLGPLAYLFAFGCVFIDERVSMMIIAISAIFFAFMSYDHPVRKAAPAHG